MKTLMLIAGIFSLNMICALAAGKPHVVFETGDEEYRSEESMPMLRESLKGISGLKSRLRIRWMTRALWTRITRPMCPGLRR